MLRLFSFMSVLVAAGVVMWPSKLVRHAEEDKPPAQECECRVVEVIHYGGNLICHERLMNNVVGSGNNMIGRARIDAMNNKNYTPEK